MDGPDSPNSDDTGLADIADATLPRGRGSDGPASLAEATGAAGGASICSFKRLIGVRDRSRWGLRAGLPPSPAANATTTKAANKAACI